MLARLDKNSRKFLNSRGLLVKYLTSFGEGKDVKGIRDGDGFVMALRFYTVSSLIFYLQKLF